MSDFGERGVWRKARKAFRCQYWLGARGRCGNIVPAGQVYFDTREGGDLGMAGGFATERICPSCAQEIGAQFTHVGGGGVFISTKT